MSLRNSTTSESRAFSGSFAWLGVYVASQAIDDAMPAKLPQTQAGDRQPAWSHERENLRGTEKASRHEAAG